MDVKVSARRGDGDSIDWDIDGKKPKKSVLEFAQGSGSHTISFKLHDSTGRHLRFDTQDPFWAHVSEVELCPAKGSSADQTKVVSCTDKELTVSNANSGDACTIHYQLNFVDQQSRAVPVDPMIKNGGGGGTI